MHYDVVIIGAGMSALAAGIRLAYFGKSVCIVERHYAFGGLNSYYKLNGYDFDVGLHAVTNYVPPGKRSAPLAKLLRQLRLTPDDFDLCQQRYSEVRFPHRQVRFTNNIEVLISEVEREFPQDIDGFRRLLSEVGQYADTRLDQKYKPARPILGEFIRDPALIEMLLCPVMYYGSAEEHDMDFTQFVTIFKSLFCEGFARPREGVRTIIKALVRKFRECGGKFRMNCGVKRINVERDRVADLTLDSGETLTADVVLSSAGYFETMQLLSDWVSSPEDEIGRLSFVETIAVIDDLPQNLGHDSTIVFFNDAETFSYARPDELVDLRSGVVCCPSNYERHEDMDKGIVRLTWLANYDRWLRLDEGAYASAKESCFAKFSECVGRYIPGIGDRVVFSDMFTPRKRRDGRTHLKNLFVCGTDQGFLGIIGAMLSGITIANLHVLSEN